jgi:4-hydroxy-2-oxoheptanedioate aldolase
VSAEDSINPLRRALAEGRATLGYLVTMPSVQLVQALARTGVDWLMLDTEHAPVGIESLAAMIAATSGTPATPIVRVPGARPELVKPVLDSAPSAWCSRRSPPAPRPRPPCRPCATLPRGDAATAILNVVLIESAESVEALDEILSVPGLDVVAIARGDLSQALGVAGQSEHPRLREVVAKAEKAILGHGGVALGGIAFSADEARALIARSAPEPSLRHDEKPWGARRNALANLLAKIWNPEMNASSTISGSLKCSRTRARHSSVISRSSRVVRSQNSRAACSRALKCGLSR